MFFCGASEPLHLCIVKGDIHQFVRPKMLQYFCVNSLYSVEVSERKKLDLLLKTRYVAMTWDLYLHRETK
jgi:hypothetical protein